VCAHSPEVRAVAGNASEATGSKSLNLPWKERTTTEAVAYCLAWSVCQLVSVGLMAVTACYLWVITPNSLAKLATATDEHARA
jgi:hypothetical protein